MKKHDISLSNPQNDGLEAADNLPDTPSDGEMTAEELFNEGKIYFFGKGVAIDYNKAMPWFLKSADKGYPYAFFIISHCYYNGLGVKTDWYVGDRLNEARQTAKAGETERAIEIYKQALKTAEDAVDSEMSPEAMYNEGEKCYNADANDHKAKFWYHKAAERGSADAMWRLVRYYESSIDVLHDYPRAVYLCKKAAEKGHVDAMNNLGMCYYNGLGIDKDLQQAAYWYQKAADEGNADAMNNLGNCYKEGDGVTWNEEKAVEWYRKAAEKGHSDAMNNLGGCYKDGKGVLRDYEQAVSWYRKAADEGNADGMYNLGSSYDVGLGIAEDSE